MKRASIIDLIGKDLGLSRNYVESLAKIANSLYVKKRIGKRSIEVPDSSLKIVQCWISDFLRATNPNLPFYVTAYENGCSIVANAAIHQDNSHILKLDIHDFFHSCKKELVRSAFSKLPSYFNERGTVQKLEVDEISLLTSLACHNGRLSVGAPSSPAIANRIMLPIDNVIVNQLPASMTYSRYSDDMTFSSKHWINTHEVVSIVTNALSTRGFSLNNRKTTCFGKGNRRTVTGIVITPDNKLSIGQKKKQEIKHSLYAVLLHKDGDPLSVLGSIYFALQVDPDWTASILAKYANYGIARECGVIGALRKLAGN